MSDNENRDGVAEWDLWDFCNSDSLSEQGLRDIIERHGLTTNSHVNIGNYEFFICTCANPSVNEGIIRFLLEYFPDAAGYTSDDVDYAGWKPLHAACDNKNATHGIIQLLIDAAPESVLSEDFDEGCIPLHFLCGNSEMNENEAIEILKLLLEKCPESIQHTDVIGQIPLHFAASKRSPAFCRILIEAYPGSERISSDNNDLLPFQDACENNNLATVEYFYNLYPDAINHASSYGEYPIHRAIRSMSWFERPYTCDIVKFLLDCDASVVLQKYQGKSPLHYACGLSCKKIDDAIQVIETLYDAHPEAIEGDELITDIQSYHQQVQAFFNGELVYARQANDHRLMTTPDENGQLPLHRALLNNVRHGSIKLLVRGNPSALRNVDRNGVLPLHVACQHHDSPSVVRYLLENDVTILGALDREGNTALHYACRGAKYDTIVMLLDEYGAVSVSTWNANGNLPIDLLLESDEVEDRESIKYIDCVFHLLKANPQIQIL